MDRESLLKQVMSYDFVNDELELFLDTHPNDMKALDMHAAISQKAKELKDLYIQQYGPILSSDSVSTDYWTWIEGPWPWEN